MSIISWYFSFFLSYASSTWSSQGTVHSHMIVVFVALDNTAVSDLKLVTATFAGKCKAGSRCTWNIQSLADCSSPAYWDCFLDFCLEVAAPAATKLMGREFLICNLFISSTTFLTTSVSTLTTWSCLHLYLTSILRQVHRAYCKEPYEPHSEHKDDTAELYLVRLAGVGRRYRIP